ncbi:MULTISPECIES: CDGSH iron-sulfur domain-containing protein [Halomicrobium]|uniref:Zinc finger CDGSH-type domain protein n=2 Tax=Halomicrobium mukohataei TaxID=57705 RepID=C7P3K0_HALMD|nr:MULTISPECIES: CDGSH iron-sulfur domain-containing protein [Halomicrobium]ACV47672.1 zinc finger CDGSH-type domain protein [Halomicrobium mukohataei DSM 12286]QCD66127.1 CDGSH iron-sulfur domain-containing protein [Halomicrobium mukohataei]QFR20932.1 CDGSH iron-sulfur domain-containing protein [Halomicrobium sp. ZPS1]
MSRLVELDATGPKKLDESDLDPEKGDIAVCQCGLSGAFPFCDGSHRRTESEDGDACYRYIGGDGSQQPKTVARVVYQDGTTEGVDE